MKNMKNRCFVIVNKDTREVLACVPESCENIILRKDIDLKVYEGTEPVFKETDHGIFLKDNTFTVTL